MDEYALSVFRELSGIDRNPRKLSGLLEKGLALRQHLAEDLLCRVIWADFEHFSLEGQRLTVGQTVFTAPAFTAYRPEQLCRVYAYLLTGPRWQAEEGAPTLELLLKTNWISAYVTAAFRYLQQYFERSLAPGLKLSPSLAPGYGMDAGQIEQFFQVLDGPQLGVTLVDGRMMVPLSSCVGMYLVYRADSVNP